MFKGLKENINIPMREIEDIKNNQVELIRLKNNTPPPKKKNPTTTMACFNSR